jgi:hypothetical protein
VNVAHLCLGVGEICCFFLAKFGRFLWLDWEGAIIKVVVDNIHFLMVCFLTLIVGV